MDKRKLRIKIPEVFIPNSGHFTVMKTAVPYPVNVSSKKGRIQNILQEVA